MNTHSMTTRSRSSERPRVLHGQAAASVAAVPTVDDGLFRGLLSAALIYAAVFALVSLVV